MSGLSKVQAASSPLPSRPLVAAKASAEPAAPAIAPDVRLEAPAGERAYQVAQAWDPADPRGMTGIQANKAITSAYSWLDGRMSAYLGEPAVANWTTFGKYASREAGSQIQRFEALEGLAHWDSFTRWKNNAMGLLLDYIGHHGSLARQGHLMWKASHKDLQDYTHNIHLMRETLVNGNAAIMHDIGPAFQTFLTAEEQGQDGVAALRAAGYGQGTKDPHLFMLHAFEKYQQARAIGDRLKTEQLTGPARAKLEADRRQLVFDANLLVGIQEQMYSLQTKHTFANYEVQALMKTFTPSMELADAANRMALLPNGGNWANFHQRMGFKEVFDPATPGALLIPDVKNHPHYYVVNPDPRALEGTIYTYFKRGNSPVVSRKLIASSPADYPTIYDSAKERIKSSWQWIKSKLGLADEPVEGYPGDLDRLVNDAPRPQAASR